MIKPTITYPDFDKLDMRIGTIVGCEGVEGSEKLLNLTVDLGVELGRRTILSGVKKYFEPEKLIGTQVLVLANLEPRKMMGMESQGMILMAVSVPMSIGTTPSQGGRDEEEITLLVPQSKVTEGTVIE